MSLGQTLCGLEPGAALEPLVGDSLSLKGLPAEPWLYGAEGCKGRKRWAGVLRAMPASAFHSLCSGTFVGCSRLHRILPRGGTDRVDMGMKKEGSEEKGALPIRGSGHLSERWL